MTDTQSTIASPPSMGDAAVDGLLAGVGAGVLMAAFLVGAGALSGATPSAVLGRFDPGAADSPVTGTLMHLAVAGVYGVLFGLGSRLLARVAPVFRSTGGAWLGGLLYAALLLLTATFVSRQDLGSPLQEFPPAHFATAHAVYAFALVYLTQRSARR